MQITFMLLLLPLAKAEDSDLLINIMDQISHLRNILYGHHPSQKPIGLSKSITPSKSRDQIRRYRYAHYQYFKCFRQFVQ